MKKKKHQPPSRIKYNQNHPTVSIRVSQELYDQLKELREKSGKSLGDILREALKKQAPSVKQAWSEGYSRGYKEAEETYKVTYPCNVCGEQLVVTDTNAKKAIVSYMEEHEWGHNACHNK